MEPNRTYNDVEKPNETSRGQLARITAKKLDRIGLEKWLNMIGITSEDVRLQTSMVNNLILRSSVESH